MDDIDFFKQLKQRPLLFIQEAWGLVPQPILPEYKDEVDLFIKNGLWDKIGVKHFDKFELGKHITWHAWLIFLAVERALINQAPKKISIVSGHGTSKSATLSKLILWYLFCFPDSQIGVTAPTADQLHSVLWKELKIWLDKMPPRLSAKYEWQNDALRFRESPETWFARARTARKENTEALSGLHGQHVFLALDEASGIDDAIYKAAEGSLTGPNTLVVLISNGTRNLGYFYDTHHSDKPNWQTLSFNSEDSPIVEKDYIQRMEQKYGRQSDEFAIRVLGKFPSSEQMDEKGFIPLVTDRDIRQLSEGIPFVGKKYLGIDASGEGDDTTRWVLRDRFQSQVIASEAISNDKGIARRTYDIIKEYELEPQDVSIGNFGTGADVAKELLLLDHKCHINTVMEGAKVESDVYFNNRMEMADRARTWLVRGGALIGDELKRDIMAYAYKISMTGKKQLMAKPNLKLRLGRSPDRGDAFLMSFASDMSMDVHSNEQINQPITDTNTNPFEAI